MYVMVPRGEIEFLPGSGDLKEPLPLDRIPGTVYCVACVDYHLYPLFLDCLYEGGICRVGVAYMGIADDGEGGMLRPGDDRYEKEENQGGEERKCLALHGHYYTPEGEERKVALYGFEPLFGAVMHHLPLTPHDAVAYDVEAWAKVTTCLSEWNSHEDFRLP